jgi:hypothetical protein
MSNDMILIDPQQALQDSKARKDIVFTMVKDEILRAGTDYGVIPGTSKPTLLKSGAERLCSAFHFDAYFDTIDAVQDWDRPLFFYRIRCHLFHVETRLEIATGIGSCNSMESKYRWRQQNRACPKCGKETIIKGKDEYGGGWICFAKKGGCGAKFKDGDPAIEGQATGQVPNDDIYSIVNTIDKMAQKRALIAAVLIGANASEFFTQDLEDMPGFGVQVTVDDAPPPPPQETTPQNAPKQPAVATEGDNGTHTTQAGKNGVWYDDPAKIDALEQRFADATKGAVISMEQALVYIRPATHKDYASGKAFYSAVMAAIDEQSKVMF